MSLAKPPELLKGQAGIATRMDLTGQLGFGVGTREAGTSLMGETLIINVLFYQVARVHRLDWTGLDAKVPHQPAATSTPRWKSY